MADLGHYQISAYTLLTLCTKGENHQMNVEQMRAEIVKAYGGGQQWAYKVSHMSDAQVTAMYLQMKKSGRIK